ncbi:MAG: hypothetical protein EOL87_03860 [Spartobacteria bacterium]|nr:hypothetical protein [Spartobacteria bacterium]
MKKSTLFKLFLFAMLAATVPQVSAQNRYYTVSNGLWHASSTWTNPLQLLSVPGSGDVAYVNHSVTVTQSLSVLAANLQTGGTLSVAQHAFLRMLRTSEWNSTKVGGQGMVINQGLLTFAGASTSTLSGDFVNEGSVQVQTPSLEINGIFNNVTQAVMNINPPQNAAWINGTGTLNNAGRFSVSAGTTCSVESLRFHNLYGMVNLETGSHLRVIGNYNTNMDMTCSLLTGSLYEVTRGGTGVISGTISSTGPGKMLFGQGKLLVTDDTVFDVHGGGFNWEGGTMTVAGDYRLENQGHMQIGSANGTTQLLQGTLINMGSVDLIGFTGSVFQTTGWQADFSNAPSGTISVDGSNPAFTASGSFHNSGSVEFNANGTTTFNAAYFQYEGTTTITRGWAELFGQMSGGQFYMGGGGLSGGQSFIMSGGSVGGSGRIANNVYQNKGTMAPGSSAGKLEIDGHFEQSGTEPELRMELGGTAPGTEYDQVTVSSTGTVSGVLSVELIDGYAPFLGDCFDLLVAPEITGRFAETNLPVLPTNRAWQLDYLTTGIQLRVSLVAPTNVVIAGPAQCVVNQDVTFSAAARPVQAESITYTWSPQPQFGQTTTQAVYLFQSTGIQTVTVIAANSAGVATGTTVTAISAQSTGQVTALISPAGAITDGAQWRLTTQTNWYSSAVTQAVVSGSYTMEFKNVTGWSTPAHQAVTVYENAATSLTGIYTCALSVSPAAFALEPSSFTGTVVITTGTGCPWSTYATHDWLAILSATNGTGSSTLTFTTTANTGKTKRVGILHINNQSVTVRQNGDFGVLGWLLLLLQ